MPKLDPYKIPLPVIQSQKGFGYDLKGVNMNTAAWRSFVEGRAFTTSYQYAK